MRYRFYRSGNKTICVSSYAGRSVRGYAKCCEADNFSPEVGEKLAQLRCDLKIAEKRKANAVKKYKEANAAAKIAMKHLAKMEEYEDSAYEEHMHLLSEYNQFMKNLKAHD